jgi:hypothetical protein
MKRALIILGVLCIVSATAFAQSQKTSRTNSRPHDRSTTIAGDSVKDASKPQEKAAPEQDMDKNNSPQKSKDNPPASGTKDEDQKKEKK